MNWCFAKVNNKLAEIYFEKDTNGTIRLFGHCYVNENEYKTKKEKRWINNDISKFRLVYRNGRYIDKNHQHIYSLIPSSSVAGLVGN
jgi:hypothetical protein